MIFKMMYLALLDIKTMMNMNQQIVVIKKELQNSNF